MLNREMKSESGSSFAIASQPFQVEKTCMDETMNERQQWRDCQDEKKGGFHRDDEGQCDPLDHHEQLSSWNLCSGGGNLLLDEFLLLWIKAPFSTSSYSQVGDYLSAGPCIQDASCESILYICLYVTKELVYQAGS